MANTIVQAVYDLKDLITGKLRTIADALTGHKTASDQVTAKVEANNKRVSDSYAKSAEGIGKLKEALIAVAAFVGLEKITEDLKGVVEAGEHIDEIGKQFDTAFGGIDKGAEALQRVRDLAKGVPQSFEDVAAAAVKLRQLGFDPLDGTLQVLLDNQNALGQSNDQLSATIDALGKANVRGGVNLKSLVALTESGIPVFDLLGKAMGVSADRVRELANTGQLGSDSIKLLVTQLGNLRAGASTAELDKTSGQINKLKDAAREFLEDIANSGALDVFRAELKNLNTEVEEAAQSGRLKELAQSVSDGIVATASAVKSAVGFVVDYAGSLVRLAQVYATFKGVNIASSILQGSVALDASARSAKAAAAEAGTATGFFGKLGAAIGGLKSSIVLTIATLGLEFALEGLAKLVAFRQETVRLDREVREGDIANAESKAKLGAAIDDVKTRFKQYADTAIESNDLLKQQGLEQLQSYKDQLEGARTFYNALVVEASAAGDAVKLQGAQAKLDQVNEAIARVNAQLNVTGIAGANAAKGLTAGAAQMIAKLAEVGTDAKAAAEIVQKAFASFDLQHSTTEAGDLAIAIDTVAAKGGKAAQVLDSTLLESLKKLSGQDLLAFQSGAIAAIDGLGKSGEATSETLKATLETALDRLKVKSEDTGVAITKTGADIIATFQAVAENSQATAQTIVAAFDAALTSAKTVDEVKALGAAFQSAAAVGKVSLKDLAEAGRELDERIRTITASISPLTSQFQLLGIKSQAQLNAVRDNAAEAFDAIVDGAAHGVAAQEDVIRAFEAYAAAARAAVADSSQAAKDTVEEQLAVLASVNGVSDAFTKAGDAGKKAGDQTKDAFGNAKDAIDDAANAADDLANKTGNAAQQAGKVGQAATQSGQAAQAAFGGVIPITEDTTQALRLMNETLERTGTLSGVSLDQAQFLLKNLGALAGAQAEVLQKRIQELEDAAAKEAEAAQRIADETSAAQDEIDQLTGNDTDIENRRHAKRLADIAKEEQSADSTSLSGANKLIQLENKLHELKLANIKKEQEAANPDKPATGGGADGTPPKGSGGSGGLGGTFQGNRPTATPAPTELHLHLDFKGAMILGDIDKAAADKIARAVQPQLAALAARSR